MSDRAGCASWLFLIAGFILIPINGYVGAALIAVFAALLGYSLANKPPK